MRLGGAKGGWGARPVPRGRSGGTLLPLVALGAVWPLLAATIAPMAGMAALAATVFGLAWRRRWGATLCLLVPALITHGVIQDRLSDRLAPKLEGREAQVTGTIAGLPERRGELTQFLFAPDVGQDLPRLLRVRWFRDAPRIGAGDRWRLSLRLQPPRSRVNFSGDDGERRFFAQGIGGLGTVHGAQSARIGPAAPGNIDHLRQRLRQWLERGLADERALGLVLALAIADRSRLAASDWEWLTLTGTGHLLAISGLHVGLAALFGYRLGRLVGGVLPVRWRLAAGLRPAWAGAWLVALAYAALAGFGVSTRRALIMLAAVTLTRLAGRRVHPMHAWWLALAGVLMLDPLAPLQAGFWLSFGAVAVLLLLFVPRTGGGGWIDRFTRAQVGITVAMFPLGMHWFQRVTALGLAGNLLAIPAVSVVIVPLILAGLGLAALGLDEIAWWALRPAAWTGDGLLRALSWLGQHGGAGAAATHRPGLAATLAAVVGCLVLLGPHGLPGRVLAGALVVQLLFVDGPKPGPGAIRLDLLDVGQGLAALVETRHSLLLYDTGPGGPGGWDLARTVLLPGIAAAGPAQPGRVIVSHGDLDHAGGLATVQRLFPFSQYLVNSRDTATRAGACDTHTSWADGDIRFQVLHPSPWLPYLGNPSSCVLSVTAGVPALLLPGDIDQAVEQRLVARGLSRHRVLIAPHHGSKTSSHPSFIRAVRPELVLVPAGAGNRFGFPDSDVIARYHDAGARVISVSDCGALRLQLDPGQPPVVTSARRKRPGPWRWPAGPGCP